MRRNKLCPDCGVVLSSENTYERSAGGRTNVCKQCSSLACCISRLRKLSLEDVSRLIEKHKHEIKMLRMYGGKNETDKN
jgi:hypothetical protein